MSENQEETTKLIVKLLEEFIKDGQFKLEKVEYGYGYINILVATVAEISIEFYLERCELSCSLIVPGYREISVHSDKIFLTDLFDVLEIDRKLLPRVLPEDLYGISLYMKPIRDNWHQIIEAFNAENRITTFKKVFFVRTHGYLPD